MQMEGQAWQGQNCTHVLTSNAAPQELPRERAEPQSSTQENWGYHSDEQMSWIECIRQGFIYAFHALSHLSLTLPLSEHRQDLTQNIQLNLVPPALTDGHWHSEFLLFHSCCSTHTFSATFLPQSFMWGSEISVLSTAASAGPNPENLADQSLQPLPLQEGQEVYFLFWHVQGLCWSVLQPDK